MLSLFIVVWDLHSEKTVKLKMWNFIHRGRIQTVRLHEGAIIEPDISKKKFIACFIFASSISVEVSEV
jgi:hypothetical protein